jgi:hypothetical protein
MIKQRHLDVFRVSVYTKYSEISVYSMYSGDAWAHKPKLTRSGFIEVHLPDRIVGDYVYNLLSVLSISLCSYGFSIRFLKLLWQCGITGIRPPRYNWNIVESGVK